MATEMVDVVVDGSRSDELSERLLHDEIDLEEEEEEQQQQTTDGNESDGSQNKLECRICGDSAQTKWNKLIHPCNCSGSISLVHSNCLEKWILNRPGNRAAGDNLECEICHAQYNVVLKHRLKYDWDTLCGCSTFSHVCEGVFLIVTVACLMAIMFAGLPTNEREREKGQASITVVTVITILMVLITLRRLFVRWYRTTSVPRVSLV